MGPSLRRVVLAAVTLALVTVAGCGRAADESRLRTDLQARLNRDVQPGLLEVVALRREGSAPLPGGDGARRVIVYFNATLKLDKDYTFGGWNQLAPSSVAYVLGATEQGLYGVLPANHAGDLLRAYGSAVYEQSAEGWASAAAVTPTQNAGAQPDTDGTAPPARSKQLIDRLASMVEVPPPGVSQQQDEIIADELARASENIERRVHRREHTFTIATGPAGNDYARFGEALVAAVNQVVPDLKLRQRNTAGSIDNAWLLARGEADYAIVQGDVAAAAIAGADAFAKGGPLENLRALGGLFAEAVHVVVLADSKIRDISELRGRRVNIGLPASGTRFDAVGVLAAYRLTSGDLGEANGEATAAALNRLQQRQLDAVFVTASAPTRALQQLAERPGLRLLPISAEAADRLAQSRPGLSALTLPPNTYPQQKQPVSTVASAALLVTTADAPASEVERVTELVFGRMRKQHVGGADVVTVSAPGELRGVTIPLHPGASRRTP